MSRRLASFIRNILYATTLLVVPTACGPGTEPADTEQMPGPALTLEATFTPILLPTTALPPSPTATPLPGLSGRILDQTTGQAVAGAQVSAGAYTTTTDAGGCYSLIGLPPGQYILSVIHLGCDPASSAIFSLAAGQPGFLDLTLYPEDTTPYPKDPKIGAICHLSCTFLVSRWEPNRFLCTGQSGSDTG